MQNLLTIDLEEWFHANYHNSFFDSDKVYAVRVVQNTERLLELFEEYGAKATFFVLGCMAKQHPQLIRRVAGAGHEIASHGYAHELVYGQTPEAFRDDVVQAKTLIEDLTGKQVKGYRAPSWSVTENSLWAWDVLEELGFIYDSSVFPIKTFLYGLPSSPRFAYHPQYKGKSLRLLEIPSSTVRIFNKNIPFAGGFYFRVLPFQLIQRCINIVNKEGAPAIVYLHPREIDPGQPRLSLKPKERFIHYYGIKRCEQKLIRLLKNFNFTSIESHFGF